VSATLRRVLVLTLGFLLAVVLAGIFPAAVRGAAWLSVAWPHRVAFALLLFVPVVLWRGSFGADAAAPKMHLSTLAPLLLGPRGFRATLRDVPIMLRAAAIVFGIGALAQPQNPLTSDLGESEGIDIVIALDLSSSMEAVFDDPAHPGAGDPSRPRPTRLDTAKEVILDFIARRKGDRIGVVVFGRSAYILSPPTLDRTVLSNMVGKMELNLVNGNGTAIGDAVGTSVARLRLSTAKSKVIILLTDGESNAGTISPEYAIHLAKTKDVRVHTIQIGNGDDVDVQRGVSLNGEPNYVRARYPVNPELLKRMARETGGEAYIATDKRGLEGSMHQILDKLDKSTFEATRAPVEELFPFLLGPMLALLFAEAFARRTLLRRFP
jgi:Ca-activated chloride channel homolog